MPLQGPRQIQAYYDDGDVVARYLERRTTQPLNGALHHAQVQLLRRLVAARTPRRVLEIASGPARLTAEVNVPGIGVAVEYSDTMLAAARARIPTTACWHFVRADAFALPIAAGQVDFVFSLRFIRRFPLVDRQRLYAEIHRVLTPGGALVLDAQNRAVALPHRQRRGLDRYPVYDELYDRPQLTAELEAAGFRTLRTEGMIKHFALQRLLNRLRLVKLGRVARALIESLEHIPGSHPSTWVLLCEKMSVREEPDG